MIRWVMLVCLVFQANVAKADHEQDVHAAAHIGMSYLIDDAFSMFYKKAFGMDDLTGEIFAAASTLFVGVLYKAEEGASGRDMLRATGLNSIGVGTHMLFHLRLQF